jgi:hypothetical protein
VKAAFVLSWGHPGAACSRQGRQPSHSPTPCCARGGRFRSRHRFATARGSSLRAPPRLLRLAHRIRDPDDRPAFLRSILTVPLHHCRYNNSNIPSVRKNLQVTSHARRKEVFASRAGDQNILEPSTPGNLQNSRRRLPEVGQRHPSPEGCASPHQLHSKTIGDPQSPTAVPIFLFFMAGAASYEGPSSVTATGLFPRWSTGSSPG